MCDSPRTGCAWRTTPYVYVAQTSNNRVIMPCELYCCLLPRCDALRTCRSGYPIATQALKYDVIAYTPFDGINYTVVDKIKPLWRRINETPVIQIAVTGATQANSVTRTHHTIYSDRIRRLQNRSTVASLKLPFA